MDTRNEFMIYSASTKSSEFPGKRWPRLDEVAMSKMAKMSNKRGEGQRRPLAVNVVNKEITIQQLSSTTPEPLQLKWNGLGLTNLTKDFLINLQKVSKYVEKTQKGWKLTLNISLTKKD